MNRGGKPIHLSPRLESIARLVTPGNRVADIGTDHAYLPIFLCQNGKAPSAIAADLRSGPLRIASANICRAGLEDRIRVRQSDGVSAFQYAETETLIIAGMGGRLICHILEEGLSILPGFREIILQPQAEICQVRCFLADHDIRISDETCTEDEGKFYPVIRAVPVSEVSENTDTPARKIYSEEELAYGPCLLHDRNPLLYNWLMRRLALTKQIEEELNGRASTSSSVRLEELGKEEQLLKTALRYYEM